MINANTVKWIQVEATTKCNAWCPGCGRNNDGYGLADDLIIEDLSNDRFKAILDQLPNLTTIDFCGTHGDAIAAANIIKLTAIAKQSADKIVVRTNGSLRTTEWWANYAKQLHSHDHEVWFCLDGLADTHSIYRQGTDFDRIIANARAFIQAGGVAVWQFIPWQHNEHQIKDCIRLSQQLGFKRFELIRNVRQNFTARQYQTGKVIEILPWSEDQRMNTLLDRRDQVLKKNCMHLEQPSVYINADGTINTCCYFNKENSVVEFKDLMDIENNLTRPKCLHFCGSPND